MLYARVNDKFHWPMAWEECQDMNKHLNKMTFGYQLVLEKKMLAAQFGEDSDDLEETQSDGAEYVLSVIRDVEVCI
jgi:hypothetical protein